ncbi:hypothetical protein HPB50_006671 [Hyalomma asiaticum]|uniref:Uncharacterized protein n=1 Tax=Hyalomma asiaticum TaxID=266040 RepID=A0ACB7RM91_HYAAI|nr:hypothetical protein HPB50_006671 [Hyalomma asiaticum]
MAAAGHSVHRRHRYVISSFGSTLIGCCSAVYFAYIAPWISLVVLSSSVPMDEETDVERKCEVAMALATISSLELDAESASEKLCSCAEDRAVADVFGIGRSTVNVIYREFCAVVVSTLEKEWVKMPSQENMPTHIKEFQAVCGFPQGVGALDGCHIPVSPPKEHATDYYNYKGWYSIVLLALVDHKYLFRYVSVGSPGRCHDAYVYRQSALAEMVSGPLFQAPAVVMNGVAVPPLILCDQAFPLTPNLVKPFKDVPDGSRRRYERFLI